VTGGGFRWRSRQKAPARGGECFGSALQEEKVTHTKKKVGVLGGGSCAEAEMGKGGSNDGYVVGEGAGVR
jgi:hypothetical protein